tara:strand:+ start:1712 stop:2170 length:459 start_codon:yes stop_codon:yes gene_type:complete
MTLDKEFIDIVEAAGDEPVLIESGDQAGYCIVPHAALMQKIVPLLSNIPMGHPLAAVRWHIETNVDCYLWEVFYDEEEEFVTKDAKSCCDWLLFALWYCRFSIPFQRNSTWKTLSGTTYCSGGSMANSIFSLSRPLLLRLKKTSDLFGQKTT